MASAPCAEVRFCEKMPRPSRMQVNNRSFPMQRSIRLSFFLESAWTGSLGVRTRWIFSAREQEPHGFEEFYSSVDVRRMMAFIRFSSLLVEDAM